MSDQDIIQNLNLVWRSISDLCDTFTEREWKMPTELPAWSAQDVISHLVSGESGLLGRPGPDHTLADVSHAKNDLGRQNEVPVDWRRSWAGERVLAEFREVTADRRRALLAMKPEDWEVEVPTPVGRGSMRERLSIRIMDAWFHEQDIRRTVGRPGNRDGPVAEFCFGRSQSAMPFVVGKKAGAPDGASVVFEIAGELGATIAIGVADGRAKLLDSVPDSPTVGLGLDFETFMCFCAGRWSISDESVRSEISIIGDMTLGEKVLTEMCFIP